MPLIRLPASEVTSQRKANPLAKWGQRGSANRVEPIALPGFDVPFAFAPGEAIFTVGSCFARNVEVALLARGFSVPARDVFRRPEFAGLDASAINNYGAPSIYNEFAWAFGARPFNPDDHILEALPGKYVDQHITPTLRPVPRDLVLARRAAIGDSYRSALNCRIVIMTLGLSEVWFDTATGYYLNVSPRPSTLKDFPDRFELHVLSYEEVYKYLEDALLLLKQHGREDLRVILTVSPVPLMLTQRPADVMVANCYSKSVLRTATEAAVAKFDFVSYYPSYESVTLSDRKFAWEDDLVHVSDAIVRINVDRMVDAFAGPQARSTTTSIDEGGEAVALMSAREARAAGAKAASRFFRDFADWSVRSPAFAVEHAQFLLSKDKAIQALRIIARHKRTDDAAVIGVETEALLRTGRAPEALEKIHLLAQKRARSGDLWVTLLKAAFSTGDPEVVVAVLQYAATVIGKSSVPFILTARFFRNRGDAEAAIRHYRMGLERKPTVPWELELAELLAGNERQDEARDILRGIRASEPADIERLRLLTQRLAPA